LIHFIAISDERITESEKKAMKRRLYMTVALERVTMMRKIGAQFLLLVLLATASARA
jgi:hypothetical protein